MGIRMLNRRPAHPPLAPVPAFAVGASTARIVLGPAEAVRLAAVDLGRAICRCRPVLALGRCLPPGVLGGVRSADAEERTGETAPWRVWADLARGYFALLLTLLPRSRPAGTLTVFVASVPALSGPPDGSAPCWSGWEPGPGATP
ncbi:hypothetical protein [Streptomyces sp. enrichment culture]|uniref:hypothetical protein n=1 Tax=Streptomyces sp. enrichment culture TaxID=1795815 RepID=UPI003F552C43